jgi:hypothetical protein
MTVKGFDNYTIDINGNVTNLKTGKIKSPVLDGQTGYYKVILWTNNKYKSFNLHYLIADHFIINEYSKPHINHKNGIKTDNRIENLEWCTVKENVRHSVDVLGNMTMAKAHNFRGVIHTEYGFFCTYKEAAIISGLHNPIMHQMLSGKRKNTTKFIWAG